MRCRKRRYHFPHWAAMTEESGASLPVRRRCGSASSIGRQWGNSSAVSGADAARRARASLGVGGSSTTGAGSSSRSGGVAREPGLSGTSRSFPRVQGPEATVRRRKFRLQSVRRIYRRLRLRSIPRLRQHGQRLKPVRRYAYDSGRTSGSSTGRPDTFNGSRSGSYGGSSNETAAVAPTPIPAAVPAGPTADRPATLAVAVRTPIPVGARERVQWFFQRRWR